MFRKNKLLLLSIIPTLILLTVIIDKWNWAQTDATAGQSLIRNILGIATDSSPVPANTVAQSSFSDIVRSATRTPMPVPTRIVPTTTKLTITVADGPKNLTEGALANFTWDISGHAGTAHTTTVYYGTTSAPGILATDISPGSLPYSDWLRDFMSGDFRLPFRFVGSVPSLSAGNYYYRAYVFIDGKHYWSEEQSFAVQRAPHHEMHVIDYPTTLYVGATATFTWDIFGPDATTGFTAIVGGNESKQGSLDNSVNLGMTPYSVLTTEFTNGTYNLPLRFVTSIVVKNPGVYYFRALAFINGKNIWSDEYSYTVQ